MLFHVMCHWGSRLGLYYVSPRRYPRQPEIAEGHTTAKDFPSVTYNARERGSLLASSTRNQHNPSIVSAHPSFVAHPSLRPRTTRPSRPTMMVGSAMIDKS